MQPDIGAAKRVCAACSTPILERVAAGLCPVCLGDRIIGVRDFPDSKGEERVLPDGFEYIDELGRGGMGVVYLAYQREPGRYVGLKKLSPTLSQNPRARMRFLQESRAAARLSHPGIVPVWQISADDRDCWYAMEYLEGGDLQQLIRRRGCLPWPEAVEMVRCLAEALHAAHLAGVAHRDIKPSNVLLGVTGSPKISDFGVAWVAGQELKELTATGEILGTPAYLAPESVIGSQRDADAKMADIYSLGALLFHLLTGRPPYTGSHPLHQFHSEFYKATRPMLSPYNVPKIPWHIADICRRCMEKMPERRYRTADELAKALQSSRDGVRTMQRVVHVLKRNRWKFVTLVLTGLIGVAGIELRKSIQAAPEATSSEAIHRVAVLPPEIQPGDEGLRLLAGGLHEDLVNAVSRLTDLRVVGSHSSRRSGLSAAQPAELKRLLGVDYVVTSGLRRWNDQVRVSVECVRLNEGTVIWSGVFDRREANLFNLQTDIATEVAVTLGGHVEPKAQELLFGTSSKNPRAQMGFLRARAMAADFSAVARNLDEIEALLEDCVAEDGLFALAYARLADIHLLNYHWGRDRREERLQLALESAQTALRLNPKLAEAEVALGNYYFRGSKDYETARRRFERALAIEADHPEALEALGYLYRRQGNFTAAAELLSKALAGDPLNGILAYNTADTYLRLRVYSTAAKLIDESLQKLPEHLPLRKLRGELYLAWRGSLKPAQDELASRERDLPTPELYIWDQVELLLHANRPDEALQILQKSSFRRLDGQMILLVRAGYEAILLALLGRVEEAGNAATEALRELDPELASNPNDSRLILHIAHLRVIAGDILAGVTLGLRTVTTGDLACVDAFDRPFYLRGLALLFTDAKQQEQAKALLLELEKLPSPYTRTYLSLHAALRPYFVEVEKSRVTL